MEKKVTKKEKFAAILDVVKYADFEEDYEGERDELIALVEGEMSALEKRAEKAKERAAKKRTEIDELGEEVLMFIEQADGEFVTIADIVAAIDDENVTAAKVQARLSKLVKAEKVVKEDITVGEDKRKRKGYALAIVEA